MARTNARLFLSPKTPGRERSHIICRVHQARHGGRPGSNSDPPKRCPRAQEAKPLHERSNWMECGEKRSRGRDADSRSSRAGNHRKQATTKEGLLDDRSQQPVEKNQVPQVDHVSAWTRGMSNDVDPNSKPDSAQQGGNKMNSSGPTPSQTLPDAASLPESNDCVQ